MKTVLSLICIVLFTLFTDISSQAQNDSIPPFIKNLESAGIMVFNIGEGYYKYHRNDSKIVVIKGDGTIIGEYTQVGEFIEERLTLTSSTRIATKTETVLKSDHTWDGKFILYEGDETTRQLFLSDYDIVDPDFNSILKFPINSFVIFKDGIGTFEDTSIGKHKGPDGYFHYLWGIMDKDGNLICEPKFEHISQSHYDGYYIIGDKSQSKFGVCDKAGNIIIPISSTFKSYRIYIDEMTGEQTFILTKDKAARREKGAYKVTDLVEAYLETNDLKKAIKICIPVI